MNESRFEQILTNTSREEGMEELAEVLREIHKENVELKKKAHPGFFGQIRKRFDVMGSDEWQVNSFLIIPLVSIILALVFTGIFSIWMTERLQGYYLRESDGCMYAKAQITWASDRQSTICIQDPKEAVAIVKALNDTPPPR